MNNFLKTCSFSKKITLNKKKKIFQAWHILPHVFPQFGIICSMQCRERSKSVRKSPRINCTSVTPCYSRRHGRFAEPLILNHDFGSKRCVHLLFARVTGPELGLLLIRHCVSQSPSRLTIAHSCLLAGAHLPFPLFCKRKGPSISACYSRVSVSFPLPLFPEFRFDYCMHTIGYFPWLAAFYGEEIIVFRRRVLYWL